MRFWTTLCAVLLAAPLALAHGTPGGHMLQQDDVRLKEQQPGRAMACRGGGFMRVSLTTDQQPVMTILFKRADVGANRDGLKPGECAWIDRPLSFEEPAIAGFWERQDRRPLDGYTFKKGAMTRGHWIDQDADPFRYVVNALNAEDVFYFSAFTSKPNAQGRRILVITTFGP